MEKRSQQRPLRVSTSIPVHGVISFSLYIPTETSPLLLVPQQPSPRIIIPVTPDDLKCPKTPVNCNSPVILNRENEVGEDLTSTKETSWSIARQVFIPFMIAGLGTVAAGLLLDDVQNWPVFLAVPEMFVLVPALLGLKGNLEMTLASRLSTQANLGYLDSSQQQWAVAFGNLALLQCQSLVLGLAASMFASIVSWSREGELNVHNLLLLSASSILTASVASLVLGSLTIFVVVACTRKFNINPDNVAAPLSASLGDVVTLALLSSVSSTLFSLTEHNDGYLWLEVCMILSLIALLPLWIVIAYRCQYTRQVLYSGWVPILSAVAISSGGGYILNFAVATFKGIAAFQPVINGIGGNLVAIQACRISTDLHRRRAKPIENRNEEFRLCTTPCSALFGDNLHARTARVLLVLSIPAQLIFVCSVHFLKSEATSLTSQFLLFYGFAALVQISILLYLARCFVPWLWKLGFDPDDSSIPFLTALGDLLGTGLLSLAFYAMQIL